MKEPSSPGASGGEVFFRSGFGPSGALAAAIYGAATTLLTVFAARRGDGALPSGGVPPAHAILLSGLLPVVFGWGCAAWFRATGCAEPSGWHAAFGLPRTFRAAVRHAAAGCAAGLFLALPLVWLTGAVRAVLLPLGVPDPPQPAMAWLLAETTPAAAKCALAVSALVLAPLGEEILYRALLWRGLGAIWPQRAASFAAALFFAALHLRLAIQPSLFFLALALSFVYRHTSLVGAFATHASFNAANLALGLLFSGAE